MDGSLTQQALNELLPYLEALDTRSAAILQLLKDKGLTTDEQFAPYLEQAGNMSNIKWLAARVRIERLLSGLDKEREKEEDDGNEKDKNKEADTTKAAQTRPEPGAKGDDRETNPEMEAQPRTQQDAKSVANDPVDKTERKRAEGDTNQGSDKSSNAGAVRTTDTTVKEAPGKNAQ